MGGRGAGAGGSGGGAKGELILPDGSKIEYEGTLHYDGNDKALTGAARTAITNWESKRASAKIEYAYAVDENGNPLGKEMRGGKGSVRIPNSYSYNQNGTTTHIHPRGDGMLGGSFSSADMTHFANGKYKTMRAAAKEGTYSMSKGSNFDSIGFKKYMKQVDKNFDAEYSKRRKDFESAYRNKKITYEEYAKANAKAFNTCLVSMHEAYRQGQKQYGYTYTLEKRN